MVSYYDEREYFVLIITVDIFIGAPKATGKIATSQSCKIG